MYTPKPSTHSSLGPNSPCLDLSVAQSGTAFCPNVTSREASRAQHPCPISAISYLLSGSSTRIQVPWELGSCPNRSHLHSSCLDSAWHIVGNLWSFVEWRNKYLVTISQMKVFEGKCSLFRDTSVLHLALCRHRKGWDNLKKYAQQFWTDKVELCFSDSSSQSGISHWN